MLVIPKINYPSKGLDGYAKDSYIQKLSDNIELKE